VTTGAVYVLRLVDPEANRLTEVAVLIVVNLLTTVLRYVGLARWVHRRRKH
jgi:hypothetical protein